MNKPWIHIIGAGVSGLSLASALARAPRLPGDVIISDPHLDRPQSQTFCFWFNHRSRALLNPEQSWSSWSFSCGERSIMHRGERCQYGMVSGEGFRRRSFQMINPHPQIHLNAEYISSAPHADHVFDSRPPKFENYRVKQSFVGLEVELEDPHNLQTVRLMHDLKLVDGGLQFVYVLPLSATRLLVEYTRFTRYETSLMTLQQLTEQWITQKMGAFSVIRMERAHIPMGLKQTPESFGIPMGARAGMTRDSTGYGFAEMHRWGEMTAQRLLHRQSPYVYRAPLIRAWMDSCLLRLIEQRAELLPQLFLELGAYLPADRFAQFMTQCHFSDALCMMLRAPKRPFLLSALGRPQWI